MLLYIFNCCVIAYFQHGKDVATGKQQSVHNYLSSIVFICKHL